MQSVKRYFRINREDICYLTFILEAYDGLAVVRTVDPRPALVEILVAPQGEDLFEDLIENLIGREGLKIIPETIDNVNK